MGFWGPKKIQALRAAEIVINKLLKQQQRPTGFGFWRTETKDANTFLCTNQENHMFHKEPMKLKGQRVWGLGDQKDRNTVQEEIL